MVTTYYSNRINDASSVFEAIGRIDSEFDELKESGDLTDEDIFNLNYRKLMQVMKLNTGYVRL